MYKYYCQYTLVFKWGENLVKEVSFKNKKKNYEEKWGWFFAAPAIIGFLVFTAVPMLMSLYLSFTNTTLGVDGAFIGIENFKTIFTTDPFFKLSLGVTFSYVVLAVPLNLICSFSVALLLNTERLKGVRFYRTIVYLPGIVPAVANAFLWKWLFNPDLGLLNKILSFMHVPAQQWIYSKSSVVPSLAFMGIWGIGANMIIFLAGLQGVPRSLYEAIEVDGGNVFHKFIYCTLPMMTPTIFFTLVMGIIGTLQAFYQAFVMTDGGPNNGSLFYAYHIYRTAFSSNKMGYASALSWILFVIVIFFTFIIFKTSNSWVYYPEGEN